MSFMVYTPEMIEFLRENAPGQSIETIAELFNNRFNENKTTRAVRGAMCRYNIAYKKHCMNYTPEMIDFLREIALNNYIETIIDLFNKKFNTNVLINLEQIMSYYNIAYKKHIFKRECKQVGTESSENNIIYIKISNDGGKAHRRRGTWKQKHVLLWENEHGPVPDGYRVMFLDKNRLNYELDNLELVSLKEFLLLNRFGLYFNDKELTKTGLAIVRHKLATLKAMTRGMNEEERKKAMQKYYREKYEGKKQNAI